MSEQPGIDGRFIDTVTLPKVGYISPKPDLTVTNVVEVFREEVAGHAIMVDTNGNRTRVAVDPSPELAVRLRPEDAKLLKELTERAIGKRVLIVFAEKPLAAPKVVVPIENGAFIIRFTSEAELRKTLDGLRRLVRPGSG